MNNGIGTLVVSTGIGKCKIAIDFILENDDVSNILITSPRENLKVNWQNELIKWGLIELSKESNVYIANNGRLVTIHFENIQTCYKWTNVIYDLIIADEIHLIATPEYSSIFRNNNNFKYKIGLTATPDIKGRQKEEKRTAYEELCPIIYTFLEGEAHGIINQTKIIVIDHFLTNNEKVEVKTKKGSFLFGELERYSYICTQYDRGIQLMAQTGSQSFFEDGANWFWNGNSRNPQQFLAARSFMTAISSRRNFLLNLNSTSAIAKSLARQLLSEQPDRKILVFSELTAQANKICKFTYHSKNKADVNKANLEALNKGEIHALGSCYSLTLGLNMTSVNTAIYESYQSSETASKQRTGRLHRLPVDEVATIYVIRVKNTQSEKWFDKIVNKSSISEVIDSKIYLK